MGIFASGDGTRNPVLPVFNEVSSLLLKKRFLTIAAWQIFSLFFFSLHVQSVSILPVVQGGERGDIEDKIVFK